MQCIRACNLHVHHHHLKTEEQEDGPGLSSPLLVQCSLSKYLVKESKEEKKGMMTPDEPDKEGRARKKTCSSLPLEEFKLLPSS